MPGSSDKAERPLLWAGLHLATLASLAVAQPLFELLSSDPMVLVTHQARPIDVVGLALLLCLVLPVALWLLECMAYKLWPPAQWALHLLLVALFLAAIALPAWKRLLLMPGNVLIGLALVTALMLTAAYARWGPVRTLLSFASPCVLIVPALFLLRDPIWSLLFPIKNVAIESAAQAERPSVVMVVFDEFNSQSLLDEHRQVDAIRYPHFAQLAEESYWFRNATTVDENTMHAVPAILTGCYPNHKLPPTLANYSRNLFSLLSHAGYELVVFEPFTTLCPDDETPQPAAAATHREQLGALAEELEDIYRRFLLPGEMVDLLPRCRALEMLRRQWDRQHSKTSGVIRYERLAKRREQFQHFIDCLRPAEQPRLYFLHVLLPHAPYKLLPSGIRHQTREDMTIGTGGIAGGIGMRSDDELEAAHEQQQYLWQLACVDLYIGRMVHQLKSQGLYDQCLLVVMADHGISFRPGQPARGTTRENYPDIMSIPLFIKPPGQKQGVISDRNVESIDVLPTIADLLDIELPWSTDGSSIFDPNVAERSHKMVNSLSGGKMSFDAVFLDKDKTLFEMLGRFGSGSKPNGLYRIGPHSELIGRQLVDLPVTTLPRWQVSIDDAYAFQDEQRQAGFRPCSLTGRIEPAPAANQPVELAVAINGTIRAVTRTYLSADYRDRWAANVPEESLTDGRNEVRLLVIHAAGKELTLEPTTRLE